MKTYQKILVFFCRIGLLIYLGLGLYRAWSSIHRLIFDRKWKNTQLPYFENISDIATKMRSFRWKADGMTELFDAVCTAQKVQAAGFDGSSPHGNDCDEEAIWLTNVINKNLDKIGQANSVVGADFFTVTWYEPATGKANGHNVCLLEYPDGWRYMDYSMPSRLCGDPNEVAELVISNYAGWNSTGHGSQPGVLIVWCRCDKNMKPIETRMGR